MSHASATTVVIPTWNSLEYLPRCLDALQAASPECPVVIVDNASADGTQAWLAEHAPHVTLIANTENEGFGAACNRGAAAATTPWLCFLNADAFVTPGWIDALHAQLDAIPAARIAVPMFLNDDGSLQEAGAMLTRDGDGVLYGYMDDPARWRYRFPRVVDYGSAACVLIDRPLFDELGGFDVPTFGLAYYEDVDLCLRAGALGWRTVYAPASVVTHIRNASTGSPAIAALRAGNQTAFAERWRVLLDRRPSAEEHDVHLHRAVAMRDADRDLRLLVLCRDLPATTDPIAEQIFAVQRMWPNGRVSVLVNSPPSDDEANAWLRHGIEICDTPQDWHGWLRARVAAFTTVVALDAMAQGDFGALVEWTQTDVPMRVYPRVRPADPWRPPHRDDRFPRLGTPVDPERWSSVDPTVTVPDLLESLGWPAPEVRIEAGSGTRLH